MDNKKLPKANNTGRLVLLIVPELLDDIAVYLSQSSLTNKCYNAAGLSAGALNASSMLMAYESELEEDMTTKPDTALREEICVIIDHALRLHKVAIQATGRAIGLMVFQERARWLGLTNLTTEEKEELLNTPVVPQGLFSEQLLPPCRRDVRRRREMMRH